MKRAMGVLGEGDKKAWAWASRATVGVGMAVECGYREQAGVGFQLHHLP
jgi:hypothetical protein